MIDDVTRASGGQTVDAGGGAQAGSGAQSDGDGDQNGVRTGAPAFFVEPVAPVGLLGEPGTPTAAPGDDQLSWGFVALGGLCVLLVAAGSLVLARRGRTGPESQRPGGDEVEAPRDDVEAALQEILAEERARDATHTGVGV